MKNDTVAMLVEIPRSLRQRVRVAAAQNEQTITLFVRRALESALVLTDGVATDAES